jgi:hypothetical protein
VSLRQSRGEVIDNGKDIDERYETYKSVKQKDDGWHIG